MKKKYLSILLLSSLVLTGVTACRGQAKPARAKKADTVQTTTSSKQAAKSAGKGSASSSSSQSAEGASSATSGNPDQAPASGEAAVTPSSQSEGQPAPANQAANQEAPAIGEESGPATGVVLNSTISQEGTYTIKARTAVKNEPALAAASVDYYEAGQKVNYDQILEADGHRWLSYVSASGVRRYFSTGSGQAGLPEGGATQAAAPSAVASNSLYGRAIGQTRVLNVPQYFQTTSVHCAPTTVSMMLASRGIVADPIALGTQMGTAAPFGTHNRDAIRILNRHLFGYEHPANGQAGYRLETVTNATSALPLFKQRVMQNIADGYPMYYTIDVSMVYPGYKGEHNIVGTGYISTPDGKDIAFLTYNDPSYQGLGQTYQGSKIITPEALLAAMTGPAATEPMYAW